ncbi:uncharacterized protein GGS22DRAFT_148924 [Annulohypoxylon maeteangense]|uniref:uncharacterized protein n=1 Tax=Annulohypoxylon maeteangense TaxID=1927788 RepID=UPI002007983E|nr:uncharacterized protein GGS22DRAFT_148924 [Annulohypoxylon maeteangense]KAI0889700.1 hypothetical protein GGS22DRAFT_148924 [Annulohypoxylon maeteangense]
MDPTARFESFSHFLQQQPTPHIRPSSSRRPSFQHATTSKPSTSSFDHGQRGGQQQQQNEQQRQQQRMAADQAYRATFASHERSVFQDEARTRARRRDAARNRALFRGPFYKRPEFYAVTLGFLGLLYPILNEYVIEP